MAGRTVLSYDDIAGPSPSSSSPTQSRSYADENHPVETPPAKRPRWMKGDPPGPSKRGRAQAHWDSSVEPTATVSYDPIPVETPAGPSTSSGAAGVARPRPPPTPKKRTLAGHIKKDSEPAASVSLGDEDAWDDSALIDAWEAANEEYERLNGPGKSWKDEPVDKSSIWYSDEKANTSYTGTAEDLVAEADAEEDEELEATLDDDHIVHTPNAVPFPDLSGVIPNFSEVAADADKYTAQEIFQQALGSAWWLGYWSAMHAVKTGAKPTDEEPGPSKET